MASALPREPAADWTGTPQPQSASRIITAALPLIGARVSGDPVETPAGRAVDSFPAPFTNADHCVGKS
jgi:hypothetical protein